MIMEDLRVTPMTMKNAHEKIKKIVWQKQGIVSQQAGPFGVINILEESFNI